MKTKCTACSFAGLDGFPDRILQQKYLARTLRIGCYVAASLAGLALSSGCATQRGTITNYSVHSGYSEPQACRFGTVAIVDASGPASFSFQKAKGKLGSAKQAILDSAELGLSGPGAGVIATGYVLSEMPYSCSDREMVFEAAVAGAAGTVTAVGAALVGPLVGAQGIIRSLRRVSPAELTEREAALTNALSVVAAQQPFRTALLQTGAEKIRGGFLYLESENSTTNHAASADAILEAQIDDLRLERAGSSEASYFLRIKTHARLVRVADGAVCFDRSAEYRSGKDLFLDWTMAGAVQSVAETGYRTLAKYYVEQLLSRSLDGKPLSL